MQRWMLGPDGWTMPVCEVATTVGDVVPLRMGAARRVESGFGFEGELLESDSAAPRGDHRADDRDAEAPATLNELTLTPVGGGTLLTLVITYPSRELRDTILGTGMIDGMEASYARLEREVLV